MFKMLSLKSHDGVTLMHPLMSLSITAKASSQFDLVSNSLDSGKLGSENLFFYYCSY